MSLLSARNLHLWRGEQHVLRGVSFALDAGQCLQVIGPNGAGKSTLLRAVVGLLPLEEGNVSWRGVDLARDRGALHRELVWLSHGNAAKAELTPLENLRFVPGGAETGAEAAEACLAGLGVPHEPGRHTRQMSAGQQRRAALARVQMQALPLWVLDEPTSNLDAAGQQLFASLLAAHLTGGGIALIATHLDLRQDASRLRTLELA